MSGLNDSLFGPLSNKYCSYFYFFSVAGLIILLFLLITGIILGLTKKMEYAYYFQLIMGILVYGMIYFQNRLLYSMCATSL